MDEVERAYVAGVLEPPGGKLTAAARHADINPKNLREKLVKDGLRRPSHADEPTGDPPPSS